ncbi:unnamed protein product [Jaminaea pallidilutea]
MASDQAAIAGPSSAAASSPPSQQHQRLQKAATTIKTYTSQDAAQVDLADYLNTTLSQPYQLYLSPPWANLRKLRTLPIPDAVIQASTSAQTVASQGLFAEIERAWIVIDSQLYLWNYLQGSSSAFESYVHPTDVIQAVSLVTPKPGVFIESIKHLLLIATNSSLTLLGVAFESTAPPNVTKELKLYQTDFSLQTSGVAILEAVSTRDGSRVFCRGSDACLYELAYQAKEGWFSSKCSLRNLTSGGVKNLLPQWAGGSIKETMDKLAVDHSRSLLYTLQSRRSISIYSIPSQKNSPLQLIATLRDIHRAASLISPNNAALLRQEDFAIISLQPIHSDESRAVCLLAVTSNGVRLYFTNQRSGYRAFTMPSSSLGGAATLELLYVRPPPSGGLSPSPTPPLATSPGDAVDYPPAQPSLQHLRHALYRDGIMLAAGPYAYEGGLDNVIGIRRSGVTSTIPNNTAIPASRDSQPASISSAVVPSSSTSSTSVPADASEQATDVLVHGATWALAEVPRPTSTQANPLQRQMTSLPRTFLALTSSGLNVLVERRPIDLLRDLLEKAGVSSTASNSESISLVEVFKRYGQAQSCAMALAVATRNSHMGLTLESLLSTDPSSSLTAQAFSSELVLHATRIFFDYGGVPRYEPPTYPHQPVTEGRVILSGRHEGFGVYASRLIGRVWERSLRDVGKGIAPGTSASSSAVTSRDMEELRGFVRSHADAFGLSLAVDPDATNAVASEGDVLAQKAEQASLKALAALLERCIEALSFVTLIGDFGWDRVLTKLSVDVKTKVDGMKFADLVLEDSSTRSSQEPSSQQPDQSVSRSLVEALIDLHSITSSSGMDVIADLLQAQCPSFCDADDVRLYKALERIRQAKEAPPGVKREELLRESERLMHKTGNKLPLERLAEVVGLWKEMDWVAGAIHLPLRCAAEWDPRGLAQRFRESGMPADDEPGRAAYDRSTRCYELVLGTLSFLDDKVEAARQNDKGAAVSQRAEESRSMAYSITQQSADPLLHQALYDFLLRTGRREQLMELRTPFLELYLQKEPLTLEKLELLWQCYTRRGEGASAARVLVGLAESTELDLNLFQRLEYLTLASNNAKSSAVGATGGAYATVTFVSEIEEKLEVAQVQVEVYRAIRELSSDDARYEDVELDDDKKNLLLNELDGQLLDISTLYRDFADPLALYDVKILIYQVSDFQDSTLIASTWESILDRAHEQGTRLVGKQRAYEHVAAAVVELGRRFMASESACPIDVLISNLESYALTQRAAQPDLPKAWAIQTMLQAHAPPEALFDALEALYQSKAEPWQTKTSLVFLLADVHYLLEAWLAAYVNSTSASLSLYGSRRSVHDGQQLKQSMSKSFSSSASLFDLASTARGSSASGVEAAGLILAAYSSSTSGGQMDSFPANRVDDALAGYLAQLNSLVGMPTRDDHGLAAETDRNLRDTLNGFKALQDQLRGVF